MLGYRVVAEFGHLAEHRPTAAAPGALRRTGPSHPGQCLQPGPHRVRVGVVGVVDHGHAVGARAHLHAVPRHRARRRKRRRDLIEASPALQRDRGRAQRVGHLMITVHRQLDVGPAPAAACRVNLGRASSSSATSSAQTSAPGERDDPHHARGGAVRHRGHHAVVGVEDHHTGGRNRLRQFGLRLGDGLARAELTEVGGADVEHDRDRRRRDPRPARRCCRDGAPTSPGSGSRCRWSRAAPSTGGPTRC